MDMKKSDRRHGLSVMLVRRMRVPALAGHAPRRLGHAPAVRPHGAVVVAAVVVAAAGAPAAGRAGRRPRDVSRAVGEHVLHHQQLLPAEVASGVRTQAVRVMFYFAAYFRVILIFTKMEIKRGQKFRLFI